MLIVLAASLGALIVCVTLHFHLFSWLTSQLPGLQVQARHRVTLGIVGAIGAHLVEIAIFAATMALLHQLPADWRVGDLVGAEGRGATDYLYCSAMSYTTLGFENITPVGNMRLIVGIEALTGLVLVAWSASFTYLQMDKYWIEHRRK